MTSPGGIGAHRDTTQTGQSLTLRDGRRLAYAVYGDPLGTPVFHFNGSGGSRLERPADPGILMDLGVRLISSDRPGHGLSDPQPGRTLLDWPEDIRQLADHLQLERFSVMGMSAGGPHALACAYRLPARVRSGALVSGLAPPDRPNPYQGLPLPNRLLMMSGRHFHPVVYLIRRLSRAMILSDPAQAAEKVASFFPEVDRKLVLEPGNRELFLANLQEGYRQGSRGPAQDDILINSPWGFDLGMISTPVDVWQGERDENVPLNQGLYQHARLPNSRLHVLPGLGHLYLLTFWRDVLAALLEN